MESDVIDGFIKKHRVKANRILTVLGQNKEFIDALNTNVGQELLKDLIEMAEIKLNTLLEMDIDKTKEKFMVARADYKAIINLLNRFQGKLAIYAKNYSDLQNLKNTQ